jgi:hypothetical protein
MGLLFFGGLTHLVWKQAQAHGWLVAIAPILLIGFVFSVVFAFYLTVEGPTHEKRDDNQGSVL